MSYESLKVSFSCKSTGSLVNVKLVMYIYTLFTILFVPYMVGLKYLGTLFHLAKLCFRRAAYNALPRGLGLSTLLMNLLHE